MRGDHVQGTEHVYDEDTVTVLSAAGSSRRYHIDRIVICHYNLILANSVYIYVTDGTTEFIPQFLAKDENYFKWVFNFGPYGWVSPKNATITLGVVDAGGKGGLSCGTYITILGRLVGN